MSGLPDVEKLADLIDELQHAAGVEADTAIAHHRAQRRVADLRRWIGEWLATYRREIAPPPCGVPAGHEGPHA